MHNDRKRKEIYIMAYNMLINGAYCDQQAPENEKLKNRSSVICHSKKFPS